jgi:hypothetical protein
MFRYEFTNVEIVVEDIKTKYFSPLRSLLRSFEVIYAYLLDISLNIEQRRFYKLFYRERSEQIF